jgi:hypothetical protein
LINASFSDKRAARSGGGAIHMLTHISPPDAT